MCIIIITPRLDSLGVYIIDITSIDTKANTSDVNSSISSINSQISALNTSLNKKIDYDTMEINFSASGNWNDYRRFGFYSGYDLANAPLSSDWVFIIVLPYNRNTDYVSQICFQIITTHVYIRYSNASSWSLWKQIH